MRPTLILVSGAPATGKSTLAVELSGRLAVRATSRDEIRSQLMDSTRGFKRLILRPAAAQRDAAARLEQEASTDLARGASVIVEFVATTEERERWAEIASNHGARFVLVECVCSDRSEYASRNASRGRAWERKQRAVMRWYGSTSSPDAIVVDTRAPVEACADEVVRQLKTEDSSGE